MDNSEFVDLLEQKMISFNSGDPMRIQHLIKVHRLAQLIGRREKLDAHTLFLTECAALVHDIGIRPAEEKYGSSIGPLQEKLGPAYAKTMLEQLGMDAGDIERISYLVGHHHTYSNIEGLDYQILVEADFLVNFYEDSLGNEAVLTALDKIFRTYTGKELCRTMYLPE